MNPEPHGADWLKRGFSKSVEGLCEPFARTMVTASSTSRGRMVSDVSKVPSKVVEEPSREEAGQLVVHTLVVGEQQPMPRLRHLDVARVSAERVGVATGGRGWRHAIATALEDQRRHAAWVRGRRGAAELHQPFE